MTDTDMLAALAAPFPPDRVSWRVGSTNADKTRGMALAYIDARDVMHRLDAAVGPQNWQCAYPHVSDKTVCSLGVRLGGEWVWKADGAGDSDFEAEKGALSDAFKRAAVRWGIGRYLYDIPAPWVAIKQAGRSFAIDDAEQPRLRALLSGAAQAPAQSPKAAPKAGPPWPILNSTGDEAAPAAEDGYKWVAAIDDLFNGQSQARIAAIWKNNRDTGAAIYKGAKADLQLHIKNLATRAGGKAAA